MAITKILVIATVDHPDDVDPTEAFDDWVRDPERYTRNIGTVGVANATPRDLSEHVITVQYDADEAMGTVTLVPGAHGPDLVIGDTIVATIDLFPPSENGGGGPPQLIFEHVSEADTQAKVLIEAAKLTLILSSELEPDWTNHPQGIKQQPMRDQVFTIPMEAR